MKKNCTIRDCNLLSLQIFWLFKLYTSCRRLNKHEEQEPDTCSVCKTTLARRQDAIKIVVWPDTSNVHKTNLEGRQVAIRLAASHVMSDKFIATATEAFAAKHFEVHINAASIKNVSNSRSYAEQTAY